MALFPESLDEIDFWDLDMFLEGDPHLAWSLLRREAPVWLHDRDGGEPFWCVTRYEDVHAVLADPLRFSSQRDGIWLRTREVLEAPPGAYRPAGLGARYRSAAPRPVAQGDLPQLHAPGHLPAGRSAPPDRPGLPG